MWFREGSAMAEAQRGDMGRGMQGNAREQRWWKAPSKSSMSAND